jgi:hypothetical protein
MVCFRYVIVNILHIGDNNNNNNNNNNGCLLAGGKIEKNEMGVACGAYGGGEVCTGCWWGSLRERGHWRDPDVDGKIILKWVFWKLEGVCGNWMELAQDRDRWPELVSTVRDFRVP